MPSNVEIKAMLRDRPAALAAAARLSEQGPETFQQEDVFFVTDRARLKLRILAPDRGELIRYERTNVAEVRRSQYSIARTGDPQALLEILSATLERAGTVRKTRTLYMVGQTRIHVDQVEGLGDFLELEVVLRPGQSEAEGKSIAAALLCEFGLADEQLIAEAYVDLLSAKQAQRS